ncbi:MAG TPA: hypothetical protein PLC09_06525 [Holophaga sp.]|nr:hypothetical protein [Holophaga sp.]
MNRLIKSTARLAPAFCFALAANGPLALAGGCYGVDYGIQYRIICDGAGCRGYAHHPDGSTTSAKLTLSEAREACGQLLESTL